MNALKGSMNLKPDVVTNGWNLNHSAIEGLTDFSKSYYNIKLNLKIMQVLYNRIINSRRNGNLPNNPSISEP